MVNSSGRMPHGLGLTASFSWPVLSSSADSRVLRRALRSIISSKAMVSAVSHAPPSSAALSATCVSESAPEAFPPPSAGIAFRTHKHRPAIDFYHSCHQGISRYSRYLTSCNTPNEGSQAQRSCLCRKWHQFAVWRPVFRPYYACQFFQGRPFSDRMLAVLPDL